MKKIKVIYKKGFIPIVIDESLDGIYLKRII